MDVATCDLVGKNSFDRKEKGRLNAGLAPIYKILLIRVWLARIRLTIRPIQDRAVGIRLVRILVRIGLADIQPVAATIRTLGLDHGQRSLQGKVQDSLRGQLDLLTLGRGLHAATQASAGGRADGSTFASASDRADDGSNAGSGADFRGCVLAAR